MFAPDWMDVAGGLQAGSLSGYPLACLDLMGNMVALWDCLPNLCKM